LAGCQPVLSTAKPGNVPVSLKPFDMHVSFLGSKIALFVLATQLSAQPTGPKPDPAPTFTFTDPSPDAVLCRGKGVEIKRRDVDRAITQFKANALARQQPVPDDRMTEVETMLLDRLVVTELLLQRATDADRDKGKELAEKFMNETREQAGSEPAFQRQLIAMSFTEQELNNQILERAVCEEVVEREVRAQAKVTDEQVRQYFEEHAERLKRPEMVRAAHILLATIDPITNQKIPDDQIAEKRKLIDSLHERAVRGEDFTQLVKSYSEDPGASDNNGIYTFPRGQMVPEFEAAAFSMQTNQISDVVTTRFGYHVIKLLQKIPAEPIEYDRVKDDIRASLERQEVQEKLLQPFLEKLKADAGLEYLNGAQPPPTNPA
jgi:peptidyl-prolyl cis-trans isomerase C